MCNQGEAAISASVELYEQSNEFPQSERQVKDDLIDVVETTSQCVVSAIDEVEDYFIQPHSVDSEALARYKAREKKIADDQRWTQLLDDFLADEEEYRNFVSAPAAVNMVPLSREHGARGQVAASAQADAFRPLQRSAAQEALTLETLKLAGYDPKALPKESLGKSVAEKQFPALEQEARPCVPTAQAAHYLMLSPQTLREWACYGRYPAELRPVRIGSRLAWPMEGIRAMLGLA